MVHDPAPAKDATIGRLQVFEVADTFADRGYSVIVPEMFEEHKPWSLTNWPPSDMDAFMKWVTEAGEFTRVAAKVKVAQQVLADKGVTAVCTLGFCWGGQGSLGMACALLSFVVKPRHGMCAPLLATNEAKSRELPC